MAYSAAIPTSGRRLRADIHMDMVGGDPFKNKSILHVTATPWSLPSFVTDVGAALAEVIRAGRRTTPRAAPRRKLLWSKIAPGSKARATSFWRT